jgi:FKBP-type peptidyl-prolyl cis-trans isomerase FkpA
MIRKKANAIVFIVFSLYLMTLMSCDPGKKMQKEEQQLIDNYLSTNSNLNFVKKPSGLYYLEIVAGTGASPVMTDSAFVLYTGKFLNGTIFDSNVTGGIPSGFALGDNITGFDEGISLMKVGGKSTFLIPSSLGYGTYGNYYAGIAGYTPLIFDVELKRIVPHTSK